MIKFRTFSNGGMQYGGFSVHASSGKIKPDFPFISENDPLMQFTGLQDSNGVDIWEGDIITADDLICEVIRGRVGWIAKWTKPRRYSESNSGSPPLGFRTHKIIGNIHRSDLGALQNGAS